MVNKESQIAWLEIMQKENYKVINKPHQTFGLEIKKKKVHKMLNVHKSVKSLVKISYDHV